MANHAAHHGVFSSFVAQGHLLYARLDVIVESASPQSNGNNQLGIPRVTDLLQVEQSLTRSRIHKLTKLMLILLLNLKVGFESSIVCEKCPSAVSGDTRMFPRKCPKRMRQPFIVLVYTPLNRMPRCVASECFTRFKGKCSLYRFPTEPKQQAVWIGKVRRDKWKPGKNVCLRSQHFASECLHEQTEHASKLIPGSVPTIFAFTRPTKATSQAAMEKRRMLQSTMTVWQNDLLC